MSSLYFVFIIVNIWIIGFFGGLFGYNSSLLPMCIILKFSFFIVNACIKKTKSSIISLILYLTFWICLFIVVFIIPHDIVGMGAGSEEWISEYPTIESFFGIVGIISLIISNAIVLVQMAKHFQNYIHKYFRRKK